MSVTDDMPDWCDRCGRHHPWGSRYIPARPTWRRRLVRTVTGPLFRVSSVLSRVANAIEDYADRPARRAFEVAKAEWEARERAEKAAR